MEGRREGIKDRRNERGNEGRNECEIEKGE